MSTESRPRVLLVDDYERLLEAWRRLLEPTCDIVGATANGREVSALVPQLEPDVIVVDLSMPGVSGFDVCREVKQIRPQTVVVLVSADDNEALRTAARRLGAAAFVSKASAGEELEGAVRGAFRREALSPPARSY